MPLKYGKKGIPSVSNYPAARYCAAAAYDEEKCVLYVFGGVNFGEVTYNYLNDVWAYYFDFKYRKSTSVNTYPSSAKFRTGYNNTTSVFQSTSSNRYGSSIGCFSLLGLGGAIVVTLSLFLLFFSCRNRNETKRINTNGPSLENETTWFNTNIGLSNHLSLQQHSRYFAKIKTIAKGGQAEIQLVQVMSQKLIKEYGLQEAVQKVFFLSRNANKVLLHEVSIMAMLKFYPYFVYILAYTLHPLSIVMKYYPESSLEEWLAGHKIDLKLKLKFSFEIASALNMMHKHSLAHCDIKTENILIELKAAFQYAIYLILE